MGKLLLFLTKIESESSSKRFGVHYGKPTFSGIIICTNMLFTRHNSDMKDANFVNLHIWGLWFERIVRCRTKIFTIIYASSSANVLSPSRADKMTSSYGNIFRVKPQSHIACNRSATSLQLKFRVVAGRLQGGCKEVGDWSPTGCRRLQGRFGRKEVLVAASETSLRPNRS